MFPTRGDCFAGRFLIEREIGSGGFARVFLAHDESTSAPVALKVLTAQPDGSYDDDVKRRFVREGRLLRQIDHDNVVRLVDVCEPDAAQPYLVFEYVAGRDLADLLNERGHLEPEEVEHIARQLLGALAAAHRAGVLHRDIKPENVRVAPRPDDSLHVKLLDFGIARATDDGAPALTKTGELIGTPRYMAPEQLTQEPVTTASDIYSLGIVLIEALLGRDAVHGGRWGDQLERLRTGFVMVPQTDEPRADPRLMRILQRMTARDPRDRLRTAESVRDALAGAPRDDAAPARTAVTASRWRVAALGVVAVVVVGALLLLGGEETDPVPSLDRRVEPSALLKQGDMAVAPTPAPSDAGQTAPVDVRRAADAGEAIPPHESIGCGYEIERRRVVDGDLVAWLPEGYDANRGYPLVVVFHSDYVDPMEWIPKAGLDELADAEEFILMAPMSVEGFAPHPHGRFGNAWEDWGDTPQLWERLYLYATSLWCVDRRHVYLVGHGDGGKAAGMLGCLPSVTATALFAFGLQVDYEGLCTVGGRPTLWLHPTESPSVPFETVKSCTGRTRIGAQETEQYLRGRHGCTGPRQRWDAPDGAACTTRTCERELVFCHLDGGATWPGLEQPQLEYALNPACRGDEAPSIALNELIWSYFESVPPLEVVPSEPL